MDGEDIELEAFDDDESEEYEAEEAEDPDAPVNQQRVNQHVNQGAPTGPTTTNAARSGAMPDRAPTGPTNAPNATPGPVPMQRPRPNVIKALVITTALIGFAVGMDHYLETLYEDDSRPKSE